MIRCDYDPTEALGLLGGLAHIAQQAARPAAQAGAEVLWKAAAAEAPVADQAHVGKGGKVYQPGTLRKAMYHAYSKDQSRPGHETYHISWNKKKAPHGHLINGGYFRRYKVIKTKSGRYVTLKAVKLAKPEQVPAARFLPKAHQKAMPAAVAAARAAFMDRYVALSRQYLAARGG
jgi:hypothetical protein